MGQIKELSGLRFGRLVAQKKTGARTSGGGVIWECLFVCGKLHSVSSSSLLRGDSKSCGCYFLEVAKEKGKRKTTHGRTPSRAYNSWIGMKDRCFNNKNPKFHRYGGRGITVCESWLAFENFYRDMGDPPRGMSLDRKNVDGNYDPSNCRWADQTTQQNNRGNNRKVMYAGESITLAELERRTGVSQDKIQQRLAKGESMQKAMRDVPMP